MRYPASEKLEIIRTVEGSHLPVKQTLDMLGILPPKEIEVAMDRGQDARLLRAIGRAWAWRHRLERGNVNTIADLSREEGNSDRYVSRVIRLAWLAPSVLERLVLRREPTVLSIFDLCGVAELPWVEQPGRVFD